MLRMEAHGAHRVVRSVMRPQSMHGRFIWSPGARAVNAEGAGAFAHDADQDT